MSALGRFHCIFIEHTSTYHGRDDQLSWLPEATQLKLSIEITQWKKDNLVANFWWKIFLRVGTNSIENFVDKSIKYIEICQKLIAVEQ